MVQGTVFPVATCQDRWLVCELAISPTIPISSIRHLVLKGNLKQQTVSGAKLSNLDTRQLIIPTWENSLGMDAVLDENDVFLI